MRARAGHAPAAPPTVKAPGVLTVAPPTVAAAAAATVTPTAAPATASAAAAEEDAWESFTLNAELQRNVRAATGPALLVPWQPEPARHGSGQGAGRYHVGRFETTHGVQWVGPRGSAPGGYKVCVGDAPFDLTREQVEIQGTTTTVTYSK